MNAAIALERCSDCQHVQYPTRNFCARCLSANVDTSPVGPSGTLLSWSVLHASLEPALQPHLPLTVASVALDEGPTVVTYFIGQAEKPGLSVRISTVADPSGTPVLVAQASTDSTPPDRLFSG